MINNACDDNTLSVGKAIPLVTFINKKFVFNPEAEEILSNPEFKNVGIISLVGKYRTGKSFLLNRVLINNNFNSNGFTVGPTIKPCTKGIWMYSKPLKIKNNHCSEEFHIFYIDTEGLGAYDEEINHDTKIFLIAVLISSLFILNSFSTIDENSINNLSLILNLSKSIKLNKDETKTNHEELAKYFPSLLWLLRDFSLKLEDKEGNTITAKQYLENAIALISKNNYESLNKEELNNEYNNINNSITNSNYFSVIEEKNKIRKMIQLYFSERDCYTMIRPVEEEDKIQDLNSLPNNQLRPEFVTQCEILRNKVIKKVKPKMFNNKVMSGKMISSLLSDIIKNLNEGSIPIIENSWNYIISNENNKYIDEGIKEYKKVLLETTKKIKEFDDNDKGYLTYINEFYNKFNEEIQNNILDKLMNKVSIINAESQETIKQKLKLKFNQEFNEFSVSNQKVYIDKFSNILNKEFKELENKIENKQYLDKESDNAVDYFLFFRDLEDINNRTEELIPFLSKTKTSNFNNLLSNITFYKSDIILSKQIQIVKKFIENLYVKEKSNIKYEIMKLKNDKDSFLNKYNSLEKEHIDLKKTYKEDKDYNNTVSNEYKAEIKSLKYNLINAENDKKNLVEKYENKVLEITKDLENKINLKDKKITNLELEVKSKDSKILTMKFNEEKIEALNLQKEQFNNKEIENLKEKNNQLNAIIKEQKVAIESLNNNSVNNDNTNNKRNNDVQSNNNIDNEDNFKDKQIESLQFQLEETKKIYDEVINGLKLNLFNNLNNNENNLNSDLNKTNLNNMQKEYMQLVDSNKNLSLAVANYEDRCKKLEDKIEHYKYIKNILQTGSEIKCNNCSKIYNIDIYKNHYEECKQNATKSQTVKKILDINNIEYNDISKKSSNNQFTSKTNNYQYNLDSNDIDININNNNNIVDNNSAPILNIKILKGIICQDDLGKPYIEYIVEVSYNLQIWRLNKKFVQFANLHKTLTKIFPNFTFPKSSCIFTNISDMVNNFHENKLKHLENYIKELSLNKQIFELPLFKKFIGFEEYAYNYNIESKHINNNSKDYIKTNNNYVCNKYELNDDEDDEYYLNCKSINKNIKKEILEISDDEIKINNSIRDNLNSSNYTYKTINKKVSDKEININSSCNNSYYSKYLTSKSNNVNKNKNYNRINDVKQSNNSNYKEQVNITNKTNSEVYNKSTYSQYTYKNDKSNNEKSYIPIKTNDPNAIIDKLDVRKRPIGGKFNNK